MKKIRLLPFLFNFIEFHAHNFCLTSENFSLSSLFLQFTLVCAGLRHLAVRYGNYWFPDWALALGFVTSLGALLLIPVMFVYVGYFTSGTWKQVGKFLLYLMPTSPL